ncbi:hypothetical protein BD410DRAFT_588813 [Rickenella mellea]|uniref:Uncharacterized protein n=1 Tax=Rickenella mellea TaxID=50990 RepID=A0A4Y7PPH0_9AGAM|nr:hypothetical protein BD410DRAFT_588813 [Rickenella mellea]
MHLEGRIITLQQKCKLLAFEDGVERLPDEILACIFEFGHQATDNNKFSFDMSHVCHHFREVALGASRLWARFHPDMIHQEQLSASWNLKFKKIDIEVFMSSHGEYSTPLINKLNIGSLTLQINILVNGPIFAWMGSYLWMIPSKKLRLCFPDLEASNIIVDSTRTSLVHMRRGIR